MTPPASQLRAVVAAALRALRRTRLSLLLPLLALAVWLAIVAAPALDTYLQLCRIGRTGHNATVHVGRYRSTITPPSFATFALNQAVVTHSHALTATYLPGAMVVMPVTVALTAPNDWYPRRLDAFTWHALTPMLDTLPACWLVGLALDALLRRRCLPWPAALLGCLLFLAFLLLLGGFALGLPAREAPRLWWAGAGLLGWTALLAAVPLAAWCQLRRR